MSSGSSLQESTSDNRRLLHFTMKITDRLAVRHFFCDILGMKILRHEEMDFACAAQCNGDFVSPWSKTMVGYGNENSVFVFELNYNYDVEGYEYGNDFSSVTIRNRQAVGNARQLLDKKFIETDNSQSIIVRSPDGHRFILINDDVSPGGNPVQCLSLNVSNLKKSVDYYTRLLEMKINEKESDDNHVKLYYGLTTTNQDSHVKTKAGFLLDNQCQLELIQVKTPINRGTGYGRKAFSCPISDVESIEKLIENNEHTILVPSMELGDLPDSKVKVVILSDPDEHEICFVGEENYFKACETDPDAENKFYKGLENKPDDPNKYVIGEDESTKQHDKQ
ncbi:unnamed protein product [Rotaria socialis]|uniref:VOC domain-containing protein n=1 Tax=Rotaria socialis TaxID=392032 RepID=A0A821HEM9_9BILA|nr:unnamed protein product [Rotaria socialis]CAF3762707.1 unnamed protein product [Rotaria socialis]CAF4373594.1 unnamed protein product [Rotaria socialis]CAF4682983.1 unnamed protein product [Rotaria socialis]